MAVKHISLLIKQTKTTDDERGRIVNPGIFQTVQIGEVDTKYDNHQWNKVSLNLAVT